MKIESLLFFTVIILIPLASISIYHTYFSFSVDPTLQLNSFVDVQEYLVDQEEERARLVQNNIHLKTRLSALEHYITTVIQDIEIREQQVLPIPNTSPPTKRIAYNHVQLFENEVVLHINRVQKHFTLPTNSMVPTFGSDATILSVVPKTEQDIFVGDIIIFTSHSSEHPIIHRVYNISQDTTGTFFVTKGDNSVVDPVKVRFSDVLSVVVGIIY